MNEIVFFVYLQTQNDYIVCTIDIWPCTKSSISNSILETQKTESEERWISLNEIRLGLFESLMHLNRACMSHAHDSCLWVITQYTVDYSWMNLFDCVWGVCTLGCSLYALLRELFIYKINGSLKWHKSGFFMVLLSLRAVNSLLTVN